MNMLVNQWRSALLLLALGAACGGNEGSGASGAPVASGGISTAGISGGLATTPGSSARPTLPAGSGTLPPQAAADAIDDG